MRPLLLALALSASACAAAQTSEPAQGEVYDFDAVDILPRLQDGRSFREAFVPDYGDRQRLCIEWTGPIYLTFVVTAEGEARDIQPLNGIDFCESPLAASVEALGTWIPGAVDGAPVATRMYLRHVQRIR